MSEGLPGEKRGGSAAPFAMPQLLSAAHEMKSPLASIRQMALLLESDALNEQDAALYTHRIRLSTERAIRLASDITRASRLEDALFACEPVHSIAVAGDVMTEMDALYAARGRRLELRRRRSPPLAVANRELLRRILINFADNALHYAPQSGVVRLAISSSRNGRRARIRVRE